MAAKKKSTTAAKKETSTVQVAAKTESVYSIKDLANAAQNVFGTMPECVEAALKRAGKTSATLGEAKKIVKEFLEREVK